MEANGGAFSAGSRWPSPNASLAARAQARCRFFLAGRREPSGPAANLLTRGAAAHRAAKPSNLDSVELTDSTFSDLSPLPKCINDDPVSESQQRRFDACGQLRDRTETETEQDGQQGPPRLDARCRNLWIALVVSLVVLWRPPHQQWYDGNGDPLNVLGMLIISYGIGSIVVMFVAVASVQWRFDDKVGLNVVVSRDEILASPADR